MAVDRNECLIFMDIDGVLATPNSIYDSPRDKRTVSNDWYPYHFDPVAVGHLNNFTDRLETPLIIVSSVWRLGRSITTLREILLRRASQLRYWGTLGKSLTHLEATRYNSGSSF
jgi:hypothetical protein